MEAGMTSHHFLPLVAARAPSTHDNTAHATLMGARHSRYGGMKILAKRIALAIPAFVDLFTRHLLKPAFAITLLIGGIRTSVQPIEPAVKVRSRRQNPEPQNYLRRDFAFALAMTAKGEATVTRTRAKTITKPNMIFLAFLGFSVGQEQGLRPAMQITITRRRMVIPERLQPQDLWDAFRMRIKVIPK
jgi:hypothetical protein